MRHAVIVDQPLPPGHPIGECFASDGRQGRELGYCAKAGPRMRVGVIGCGYWGAKHVRVLSSLPEVSLVVAIDARPDRTEPLKRMYPSALCATDLDGVV